MNGTEIHHFPGDRDSDTCLPEAETTYPNGLVFQERECSSRGIWNAPDEQCSSKIAFMSILSNMLNIAWNIIFQI